MGLYADQERILADQLLAIGAAAEAEGRGMTPEELGNFTVVDQRLKALSVEAGKERAADALAAASYTPPPRVDPGGVPTATPIPQTGRTSYSGGTPVAHRFAHGGFTQGPGEFLAAVYSRSVSGVADPRLRPLNAITTFGGEMVGADGGFALPEQFAAGIMSAILAEDSFVQALNPIPASSNMIVVPINENPSWSTSGITAAQTAEGAAITASKPAIKQVKIAMHSVKSLVHVSDESLGDMPFLAEFVMREMAEHLRFQVENYIVNGTGEDEPLGFLNAPATYALTDVNSTASAIGAADVFAMKAALLPGSGAFWIVNPTVLPAIWGLKSDATNGYPLFAPDMKVAPEGMLLGLPIYRSEACPILNVTGDIMLVQPRGYILAMRGIKSASTIAFAFDQDLQSFRSTLRIGGAPVLSAKVARAKSASSYSSHVIALTGSRS